MKRSIRRATYSIAFGVVTTERARMVYESQISFTLDTICPWSVDFLINTQGVNSRLILTLGLTWPRKGGCCSQLLKKAGLMIHACIRLDIGTAIS